VSALVQLFDEDGQIWVNPLGVLSVVPEDDHVFIHMVGGYRVALPVPEGSSPDAHARMVVGKINTGLVAEYK
jgi:hypothetical protein